MADFNIRADEVDVEQIMRQIRARIREKRGVDYTEEQIQALAKVRLEKFLDPKGLRSDLLEQFRQTAHLDVPPTYEFDDTTIFESDKGIVRFFRRLFRPVLKLLFNPNPLNRVLHMQTEINRYLLERTARDVLFFEVIHNLVVEMTRTGIEVKNMEMRVESIASRLDFNERRSRALEAVVQYKPDAPAGERRAAPSGSTQAGRPESADAPSGVDPLTGGESLRSRRRRRRRGRRNFGEERGASDERRVTGDELERRTTNGEPEPRTTNDEPERRTTVDEPRTENHEPNTEHGTSNAEPDVHEKGSDSDQS